MKEKPVRLGGRRIFSFVEILSVIVILVFFAGVFLGPTSGHNPDLALRFADSRYCEDIGECLAKYAIDHHGLYPEGKTSTEVFQHLLDEHYASDPIMFNLPYKNMPGKVAPDGNHLKPENVCWDVTIGVDSSAPDGLPIVFLTGYKVAYQAGEKAIAVNPFVPEARTWSRWLEGYGTIKPFIAVCYKNNSVRAIHADKDGSIPNFIPADFDPKGKTYRQLTPDGTLP
jgi:hypothetical protein